MNEKDQVMAFMDFAFSKTDTLLFDRPSTRLSTKAFISILHEEIDQKDYQECMLYRMIIAGLEQQLPVIMSRSLHRIDVTPQTIWTDILDEIFASQVLVAWRRRIITDHIFLKIAGQPYRIVLDGGGPTTLLETIIFPSDPPPVLSFANPWPN